MIIKKIKRQDSWLPPFNYEYDGKYLSIKGRDTNHIITSYGNPTPIYDECILIPVAYESRKIDEVKLSFDEKHIILYIKELNDISINPYQSIFKH